MPVDGILVGTAAMATLEATTSPAVKQLLVDTNGTDVWVGAGKAQGGMASGRSQLGADIHEIDNTASRCGRLLDEVAGDADAVAERRDEIIAAMADTAKPYFGDVADMTYLQWLDRYVELAIGEGDSTADTKAADSPWLDVTWRDRFEEMLKRAEARLHPQRLGPDRHACSPATPKAKRCWRIRQPRDRRAAGSRYPDAETVKLHPGRRAVLHHPVQDARASRSTSCPSSTRTCGAGGAATRCGRRTTPATPPTRCASSPAPQAVAGITRVDEPVGELLDRFEQAAIDEVRRRRRRAGRRWCPAARPAPTSPARSPWCSTRPTCCGPAAPRSTRCTASARPSEWQVNENRSAVHPSTGSRLELTDERCHAERAAVRHLDRDPADAAGRHGQRRHARGHHRGRRRPRCAPCWRSPPASTALDALPAVRRRHRHRHRRLGSRGGRRPHRRHRHLRRAAGARA